MLTDFQRVMETVLIAGIAGGLTLAGCSEDESSTPDTQGVNTPSAEAGCPGAEAGCPGAGCPGAGCPGAGCPGTAGDAQTPPTGEPAAIDQWLAAGSYKTWKCEPAARAAIGNSPHGQARVCSNNLLSGNPDTAAEFPVGSAGVKEIFQNGAVTGLAVYLKQEAGKGGQGWYWYEKLGGQVLANGKGVSGCTGCHSGAPAKDQVFTQVK